MDDDGFVKPSFVVPKAVKQNANGNSESHKEETNKKETKLEAESERIKDTADVIETEKKHIAEPCNPPDKKINVVGVSNESIVGVSKESIPTKPAAEDAPVLQYKEPKWSSPAAFPYTLEVLKGGQIVEEVDISESSVVTVGRLPSCDVPCLHPSISRYHAVFQHRSPDGDVPGAVFVYDLGSSYGTVVNKVKIAAKTYYMLKTGYVIKFGASTRLYIVKGPPEEAFDDEKEMIQEPKTATQEEKFKKLGILASEEAELMLSMLRDREKETDEVQESEEGVSWGFREDAPEEDDGDLKLDLTKMNKPVDFKDPKKTLRGFFEREGVELEYVVTDTGLGKHHTYICKVELPLDTPAPVIAEGTSSGKKRDAVMACAVHGCRLLDAYGVLRSSRRNEDIETRNQKLAKNDFYDSDEDTFNDRTGEVEQKRKRRMLKAGVEENKVTKSRTHEMLTEELKQMNEEIAKLQKVISDSKKAAAVDQDVDELDAYMASVSEATVDAGALKDARKKLFDLKLDRVKLERLCEMAKPIALPEVKRLPSVPKNVTTGKVGKVSISRILPQPPTQTIKSDNVSNSQKRIKIDLTRAVASTSSVSETTSCTERISVEANSETADEKPASPQQQPIPVPDDKMECSDESAQTSKQSETNQSEASEEQTTKTGEIHTQTIKIKNKQPNKRTAPKQGKAKKKTPQNATLTENISWDDDLHDENFVNWTPPVGQSGDGRTKLNDKYGY